METNYDSAVPFALIGHNLRPNYSLFRQFTLAVAGNCTANRRQELALRKTRIASLVANKQRGVKGVLNCCNYVQFCRSLTKAHVGLGFTVDELLSLAIILDTSCVGLITSDCLLKFCNQFDDCLISRSIHPDLSLRLFFLATLDSVFLRLCMDKVAPTTRQQASRDSNSHGSYLVRYAQYLAQRVKLTQNPADCKPSGYWLQEFWITQHKSEQPDHHDHHDMSPHDADNNSQHSHVPDLKSSVASIVAQSKELEASLARVDAENGNLVELWNRLQDMQDGLQRSMQQHSSPVAPPAPPPADAFPDSIDLHGGHSRMLRPEDLQLDNTSLSTVPPASTASMSTAAARTATARPTSRVVKPGATSKAPQTPAAPPAPLTGVRARKAMAEQVRVQTAQLEQTYQLDLSAYLCKESAAPLPTAIRTPLHRQQHDNRNVYDAERLQWVPTHVYTRPDERFQSTADLRLAEKVNQIAYYS